MKKFAEVEEFVTEFRPLHKKVIWIIGLIVGGSIAFWLKWFWAHVKWNA